MQRNYLYTNIRFRFKLLEKKSKRIIFPFMWSYINSFFFIDSHNIYENEGLSQKIFVTLVVSLSDNFIFINT